MNYYGPVMGGTLEGELHRTAELLVELAETQGVYFVVAFLYDAGYDAVLIKALLPILAKKPGARTPPNKEETSDEYKRLE